MNVKHIRNTLLVRLVSSMNRYLPIIQCSCRHQCCETMCSEEMAVQPLLGRRGGKVT